MLEMQNLKGILTSGFDFENDETLLKFRFRLLNSCLLVAMFFAFLVALLFDSNLHDTGNIHSRVNYFYSISSLALLFWLRRSKEYYFRVAISLIIISLCVFTSVLLFVVDDQSRIIWFYIIIFVAYTTIGNRAGIVTTVTSIGIIVLCFNYYDLGMSRTTVQGALIGLVISSVLASVHVRKIIDFENVLLKKNRELEVLATVDGLTGVMNKRMFNEMMNKYIEAAHRNHQPLSFLFLDLDHFKKINDQNGHQVGDIMLIKFTDIVGKCLRKSDLLGRVGGEEFAVMLFETDLESAASVAEKIRLKVQEAYYEYDGKRVEMTTSIGLARLETELDNVESIQKRADEALYQAKHSGRNRVEIATYVEPVEQLTIFSD